MCFIRIPNTEFQLVYLFLENSERNLLDVYRQKERKEGKEMSGARKAECSGEQEQRFAATFNLQDFNHKGEMSYEDFENLIVKWSENFKIDTRSVAYKKQISKTKGEWMRICSLNNKPRTGNITEEEYVNWASLWQVDYKDATTFSKIAGGGWGLQFFTRAADKHTGRIDAQQFVELISSFLFGGVTFENPKELGEKEFAERNIKIEEGMDLNQWNRWRYDFWTSKNDFGYIIPEILKITTPYRGKGPAPKIEQDTQVEEENPRKRKPESEIEQEEEEEEEEEEEKGTNDDDNNKDTQKPTYVVESD